MAKNMTRKGEVTEVGFRPAKGGVVSETRRRFKRSGQGGGPDFDHETETAVHATPESAAAHLKTVLGHAFAESTEANREAAEGETEE
jgi:hypothetical protein